MQIERDRRLGSPAQQRAHEVEPALRTQARAQVSRAPEEHARHEPHDERDGDHRERGEDQVREHEGEECQDERRPPAQRRSAHPLQEPERGELLGQNVEQAARRGQDAAAASPPSLALSAARTSPTRMFRLDSMSD